MAKTTPARKTAKSPQRPAKAATRRAEPKRAPAPRREAPTRKAPAPKRAGAKAAAPRTVTLSQKAPAAPPSRGPKMFVNLPVKDLKRSMEFFRKLGYAFNPQFTDENATCMIIGEDNFAMLLTERFFKTFTPKSIADATKSAEVLVALSCDNRQAVDDIVRKALAAGGRKYREAQDQGFMYSWGFEDPDGHTWEHFWMDPAAIQPPPQAEVRSR